MVSDDVSVSYGASSLDYSSALEDQESSAVSVSFTAGGVATSASHQTTDNVAGATATDNSSYEQLLCILIKEVNFIYKGPFLGPFF